MLEAGIVGAVISVTLILPILIVFLIFGLLIFILGFYLSKPSPSMDFSTLRRKHVMITGGSSGIGRSLALRAARMSANISLIARDLRKLEDTVEEVKKNMQNPLEQRVYVISADVSSDWEGLKEKLKAAENELGPVSYLINCAGFCISRVFEDLREKDFRSMMDVNFMGSVAVTRAVIEGMKEKREGHIVFLSSLAGVFGMYGFTGYSPSKFALKGFAEALAMEVKPWDIHVTLAMPPDTDTPGFAQEEMGKPEITKKISGTVDLKPCDEVAEAIFKDILARRFLSTCGSLLGEALTSVAVGMSPKDGPVRLLGQVTTRFVFGLGPLRIVTVAILHHFDRLVARGLEEAGTPSAQPGSSPVLRPS
ncbi:unnamed protein product [Darwinula stevensoni]|uniref:3-dehydrosphinganine reductase n=1 Tax=Darwinula stevensoni TaxID=69355 RepID=A0A7R9AGK3_9CRUS|nr:unnamed protein product [Darwinula stevensoni]CAG0903765.1 unnamed protein product [Darwinula stevensoni]